MIQVMNIDALHAHIFKAADIQTLKNQTADCQVVQSSGNLLQKLLGDFYL